jgi:hypothetical protein
MVIHDSSNLLEKMFLHGFEVSESKLIPCSRYLPMLLQLGFAEGEDRFGISQLAESILLCLVEIVKKRKN